MLNSRPVRAACLVSALFLFACGTDSTGNSGDSVTPAEATLLMQALFDFVGDNLTLYAAPAASPARTPYGDLYDPVIDVTEECDVGGTATLDGTISGDVDTAAETADLDIVVTADYFGCRFYISELNIITIDGQPDVDFDANLLIDEGQDTETDVVDISGSVAFTITDGRSGTCAIDAVVTITSTSTTDEVVATGSVCGSNAASLDFWD